MISLTARPVLVAVFGLVIAMAFLHAAKTMAEPPFPQRRQAPLLPNDLAWLNTASPLRLEDLRGKFVLLDFWTYCCINCMHILPELEKLEKAYPKNLVVLGVHSAKFSAEQDSENIVEAILRYKIEHPVINDAHHVVWDAFGVQAWPTLVLIDPEGYIVWEASGERTFEQLDPILKKALPYYRQKKLLDESPLRFALEAERREPTPLRFPGKIVADEASQRLFIADSGHNRLVVARMDGTLLDVIGSGERGNVDGDFAAARFNDPQGLALDGERLYVADTKNHTIRQVDLATRRVTTVAGTGQQRRERPSLRKSASKSRALDSPWDLWIHGRELYIAMAGAHQLWRMSLDEAVIAPYAGNGREDIVDGPLLPETPYELGSASFAQPSGLAFDGRELFVADSEGSSLRSVPLDAQGSVRTIVGTAGRATARLFTFGDVDGPASRVRLQHPLGVAYAEGRLFVADTYNNKIKTVDVQSGETHTLVTTAEGEKDNSRPNFSEPAGIAAAAGRLYVADTNQHEIRVIDLRQGNRLSTLRIADLEPPKPPAAPRSIAQLFPGATPRRRAATIVRAEEGKLRLRMDVKLPAGYHLNSAAPLSYLIEAESSETPLIAPESLGKPTRVSPPALPLQIALPVTTSNGQQTIRVGLAFYYCREGAAGVCKAGSIVWTLPLKLSDAAASSMLELSEVIP